MALSPETTTLRKEARVYPFVKSGRVINPYGFDPTGPQRGQWAERPGGEETLALGCGRGGGKGGGGGGEGGRQRKEGDAGCVRVVPCGIGRSQVRHAFLLRS